LRGRAFAFNQVVQFAVVPLVAFISYLLVPTAPLGFDGWRWVVGRVAEIWLAPYRRRPSC
jgi:putative MFS transporter